MWSRKALWVASPAYGFGVAVLALLYRFPGESWPPIALLLYAPQHLVLLPLVPLGTVALLLNRRLFALLAAAAVVGLRVFTGFHWAPPPTRPPGSLTVVTYNRGQHGNQSMRPFIDRIRPDVIALQDAKRRGAGYHSSYPDYPHLAEADEFVLLSRLPVRETELIRLSLADGLPRPVAARSVLELEGRPVAFYNVHLPTPRDALRSAGIRTLLLSMLPTATGPRSEAAREIKAYWRSRLEMAAELNRRIRTDPLPALAAGDFNTPGLGRIHRWLTRDLIDAHPARGSGFGHTFPGTTGNPLTGFGPWLRLDRVLTDRRWRIHAAITEPHRPSQHRAFAATVSLHPRRSGNPPLP